MTGKIINLKLERSLSLNAKVAVAADKESAHEEDQFTRDFLAGDTATGDTGINGLFYLYYKEKNYEKGTTYNKPTLSSWGDSWETIHSNAIKAYGDWKDGFYPPDEFGVGAQTMNTNTFYLHDNGQSIPSSSGIKGKLDDVIDAIGDSATAGDSRHISGYVYESSGLAQAVGETLAATEVGTGLRGKRTENSDVTTQEKPGDSFWRYVIGDGGGDTINYYKDPEKSTLQTAIGSAIDSTKSGSTYRNHLTVIYNTVSKIEGDSNHLFVDSNLNTYVLTGDTGNIDTLETNLDNYLGVSGDTVTDGDSTIWAYDSYFDDADGTEGDFDEQLNALKIIIGSGSGGSIKLIEDRHTFIGDSVIGVGLSSSNLKKARYFWAEQRIGKPVATLINYNGLDDAISFANDKLADIDERLDFLFNDPNVYIPKPTIYSIYENPWISDATGQILQRRVGVVWGGQQHVNKYSLYRKIIGEDQVDLTDTAWGDTFVIKTITDLDEDTGFVTTTYLDTDSIVSGKKYIYRIRCVDDINDVFTSRSEQTDILSTGDSFISIAEGTDISIIDFGREHEFKKGEYVIVKAKSKPSADGFYKVVRKVDYTIQVQPQIKVLNTDIGKIYKTDCTVFVG